MSNFPSLPHPLPRNTHTSVQHNMLSPVGRMMIGKAIHEVRQAMAKCSESPWSQCWEAELES